METCNLINFATSDFFNELILITHPHELRIQAKVNPRTFILDNDKLWLDNIFDDILNQGYLFNDIVEQLCVVNNFLLTYSLIGFSKREQIKDSARTIYATTENCTNELALRIAVNPTSKTCFGTLRSIGFVFSSSGEQIYLAEIVILSVHGIHTVDESLHLTAHLIIINGSCPAHNVCGKYLGHDIVDIVFNNAMANL